MKTEKMLIMLCGAPASGKSTWAKVNCKEDGVIISRDTIRYALVDGDVNKYFSKENLVFDTFINEINTCLNMYNIHKIYVDATHLTEKSRNKVLDKLNLNENVKIKIVNFIDDIDCCLKHNNLRKDFDRVPESAIRRMRMQFEPATNNEKYKYNEIVNIKNGMIV